MVKMIKVDDAVHVLLKTRAAIQGCSIQELADSILLRHFQTDQPLIDLVLANLKGQKKVIEALRSLQDTSPPTTPVPVAPERQSDSD